MMWLITAMEELGPFIATVARYAGPALTAAKMLKEGIATDKSYGGLSLTYRSANLSQFARAQSAYTLTPEHEDRIVFMMDLSNALKRLRKDATLSIDQKNWLSVRSFIVGNLLDQCLLKNEYKEEDKNVPLRSLTKLQLSNLMTMLVIPVRANHFSAAAMLHVNRALFTNVAHQVATARISPVRIADLYYKYVNDRRWNPNLITAETMAKYVGDLAILMVDGTSKAGEAKDYLDKVRIKDIPLSKDAKMMVVEHATEVALVMTAVIYPLSTIKARKFSYIPDFEPSEFATLRRILNLGPEFFTAYQSIARKDILSSTNLPLIQPALTDTP